MRENLCYLEIEFFHKSSSVIIYFFLITIYAFRKIIEMIMCNALLYDELNRRKFHFNDSSDFVDYLKELNAMNRWFRKRKALWNQRENPLFAETLTVGSVGFAFNLLKMEEILNVDKLVEQINQT